MLNFKCAAAPAHTQMLCRMGALIAEESVKGHSKERSKPAGCPPEEEAAGRSPPNRTCLWVA